MAAKPHPIAIPADSARKSLIIMVYPFPGRGRASRGTRPLPEENEFTKPIKGLRAVLRGVTVAQDFTHEQLEESVIAALDTTTLVERIPLPSLLIGLDSHVIAANRAMSRCLACNTAQLVGTALAAWVHEPTKLMDLLQAKSEAPGELRFRAADGNERWLELAAHRDTDTTYLLSGLDITARRTAELALNEERERYLEMISAVSDTFWEGLGASRSRIRIFVPRRERGALTLKTFDRKWPDDLADQSYDPQGFAAFQEKHERHEQYRDIIFRSLRKDGKEQYHRASAVPWYSAGVFQGFRGVSVDVTAQVLAERAFRQSQRHLEHAQRVAATGSSEYDFQTGIEEWSGEFYRILGVDRASFVRTDKSVLALIHREDRARVKADSLQARTGLPTPPAEYRIIRPDGECRTVYVERDVQCDETGTAIRLLTVVKDVTELRAAEQRQGVAERQLLHSQKLEALGTLAGGVAHELNNTLVPILALTQMVASGLPQSDKGRDSLDVVIQAAKRARDLVKQILAFSRKETPIHRYLDLANVTEESLNMLRGSLPATIEIKKHLGNVPMLLGDPGQLGQVVTNLVTNAAQAIGPQFGTIKVELACEPVSRNAPPLIRLSVRDTGCGMDEATKERIFEPFFTTKPVGEGTGLGLSVVHGIISEHGGRVTVESSFGKGTLFNVYLPACAADMGEP